VNAKSPQLTITLVFGVVGGFLGLLLATDSRNSDSDLVGFCIILAFIAYGILAFLTLVFAIGEMLLLRSFLSGVIAFLTFQISSWFQCPSNIRYEFSYPGNTGTFQKVQFYNKVAGRWLEGPSVEGWPLTVSFPDINHDGYPDIRVVESEAPQKGVIEFIYIPEPKDNVYWKAGKMKSALSASYLPGKIFYP